MDRQISFEIRRAGPADAEAIARAHLDSILSIGPRYYDEAVVREWGAHIEAGLYVRAMARGEVFFVAIDARDPDHAVLGFSSHPVDDDEHGVGVYVRGKAARKGVGTALLRAAEHDAIAAGARRLTIDASLAAVDFYKRHRFTEVGRGSHRLPSGLSMPCVFMEKSLPTNAPSGRLALPLHTDRLRLRDFTNDDFDAIQAYASDGDVTRYMFFGPRTEDETRGYLDRMLASQRATPRMIWELAVVRVADEQLIGGCDLTLMRADEADLGFILRRDVWGRGYATEAARALVRAAFDELGVTRVVATCDVNNHASAHVLGKAGLHLEGTLERHKFAKGVWWTSYLYTLTRERWHGEPI